MARALDTRKFIEDGKWWAQGRVRGPKIACFSNPENDEFWRITLAACNCIKVFGPAGGRSLSARTPLVVRIWLVETILSLYRESYKQCFCQRVLPQNFGRKENPRHGDTFSSITLVSLDGCRWGLVGFELKHQRLIWPEFWNPDNSLRTESGGSKVGFVVQKSHVSGILKIKNFGELRSLHALVQNVSALPGAARWALASPIVVRIWLVETILSLSGET